MVKKFSRYAALFTVSVCVAVLLLFLAAFVPKNLVDAHVAQSADIMMDDGLYPSVFDKSKTSILDTWTDAIILAQCKSMSSDQLDSVLSNPMYGSAKDDPVANLYEYVHTQDPHPTSYYPRYWMGFRAVIRCLLVFFDYYQILRYLAVIVLTLWCATICSIARHMDTKAAFLFAVSIVLVRPQVVVMSLQFSCCFIIAFCAMLLIPRLAATSGKDGPFFFMIGIITMYFDFYTTPTLTLCLPMMYLFILRQKEGTAGRFRLTDACRCVLLWGVGYLGMWFAKMVLTTVFTDQNGLQNGIQAMLSHLRGERLDGLTGRYTLLDSIYVVWYALSCDTAGKWVVLLSGFMGIIWILTSAIRAHIVFSDLKGLSVLFLLTAIPIIWMLAAPKVIYIHYWFQYRSIAASFWGVGLCCMTIFKRARCRKRQGTNAAFRQSNNTSS